MRWAVEIERTELDPRNLGDLLAALGFVVVDTGKHPGMHSPEIDGCATAAAAFDVAKEVRAAFTGPAKIDESFQLGSVVDYSSDPPRRHAFLEVHCAVHFTATGSLTVRVDPPSGLTADEVTQWHDSKKEESYQRKLEDQRARLEPVFRNYRASRVLGMLARQNPSGEHLYKLYELLEEHPSKRAAFHQRFSISRDQFKRFSDAVHNPAVSGDWARHAYHDPPKTNNPMSPSEAEAFVRRVASDWLHTQRTMP